jgi:hypothetical protein
LFAAVLREGKSVAENRAAGAHRARPWVLWVLGTLDSPTARHVFDEAAAALAGDANLVIGPLFGGIVT